MGGGNNVRELWIDNLKGILIILVVFGHFIGGTPSQNFDIYGITHYLIYSIHMPMFILISGYLCINKWSIKKLVRNYIVPYIVFDLLWVIYSIIRGTIGIEALNILFPEYVYWFIFCLFFLRIIVYIPKFNALFFVISLLVSLIAPIIHQRLWCFISLGRILLLYPIFYIGKNYARKLFDKIHLHKGSLLILIGICFLEIMLLMCGITSVSWATHDYPHNISESILKLLFMLFTLCMFLCFSILLPNKPNILSKWGKNSLLVYLLHPFAVDIFRALINKLHLQWNILVFGVALIISVIITEVFSMEWIKASYDRFMFKLDDLFHLND